MLRRGHFIKPKEHGPFGPGNVPMISKLGDESAVERYKEKRVRDHSHERRGAGVTRNQAFESSGKKPGDGAGGVPKQYPWHDKDLTVAKSRSLMKDAHRYTNEDRADLVEHIQKLHPQILTSRRRF